MNAVLERARTVLREVRAEGGHQWSDVGALAEALYSRWYHTAGEGFRECPDAAGYRAAYGPGAAFEAGWRVVTAWPDAGPGAVLAEAAGQQRILHATEYVPAETGRLRVSPGDAVLVRTRIDDLSGGFWHLWSSGWRAAPPELVVRVYFQVAPGHEAAFVAAIAAHAPLAAVWNIKILSGLHPHGRNDAAVLYLDRKDGVHVEWLDRLVASVAPLLLEGAPPFTAPLARGVAWAEDPGGGVSFGQHRCRVLASAARKRPASLDNARSWQRAATESFTREGLDIRQPHLHGTGARPLADVI